MHGRAAGSAAAPLEAFLNAASPGVVAPFQPNDFYATQDEYLAALAEALRPEYEAIVNAGFLLQIDAPDLGMSRHTMYRDRGVEDFLSLAAKHIEVLNHALRNVPADRTRMHVCWGNYEGPHHHDVPLERLLPVVLRAKPQGLLFEGANPRHANEWAVFKGASLPEDKDTDSRGHQLDHQLHRAPAAGGGADRETRLHRWAGAGDRRHRLRLRNVRRLRARRARDRVLEAFRPGRGRPDRERETLGRLSAGGGRDGPRLVPASASPRAIGQGIPAGTLAMRRVTEPVCRQSPSRREGILERADLAFL